MTTNLTSQNLNGKTSTMTSAVPHQGKSARSNRPANRRESLLNALLRVFSSVAW